MVLPVFCTKSAFVIIRKLPVPMPVRQELCPDVPLDVPKLELLRYWDFWYHTIRDVSPYRTVWYRYWYGMLPYHTIPCGTGIIRCSNLSIWPTNMKFSVASILTSDTLPVPRADAYGTHTTHDCTVDLFIVVPRYSRQMKKVHHLTFLILCPSVRVEVVLN